MNREHTDQVQKAAKAVKGKKINHFYFVACGGSMALLTPAQHIMDKEIEIPSSVYSSNEFILRAPKALSPDSIVISCSHSGTTPETVKATELARKKGALTITFSNVVDSPLWKAAEYPIHYDWGNDINASDSNNAVLYALIFNILNELQAEAKYARAIACVDKLPAVYDKNLEKYSESAMEFGRTNKRESIIYTMASGINYGPAYAYAICILMEMQWIHSSVIHAGEYFHGPFEITDYDVPFIIIKGLDDCRIMDDRAHAFCQKYSEKITLIDAADFDMSDIDEELRSYFAPLVVGKILRKYADELAEYRGHPLSVRRYMWKMEY